jgi:hypothetical protein
LMDYVSWRILFIDKNGCLAVGPASGLTSFPVSGKPSIISAFCF